VAAICASGEPVRRRNESARGLLAEFVDAEQLPHRILARPSADGDSAHHLDVELISGHTALVHGSSGYTRAGDGALITILELQCDRSGISAGTLAALTPRKSDMAHSS
jgi:hypothetical protein